MDEEYTERYKKEPVYYVCKCITGDDDSTKEVEISLRKEHILSTVLRTENYLKERRIPELIRFLLTKLIAQEPTQPVLYLEKLLDDSMLFRAGHGLPPVLYEEKHLEEIIKSFDPGQRGWMTAGQVSRAYSVLGLTCYNNAQDKVSTDVVFQSLKKAQEDQLLNMLSAGIETEDTEIFI